MTAALEGDEWSAARPGRTLPPGKTRYPFYRRLGGPQGRSGRAENFVPNGIRSRTHQPSPRPFPNREMLFIYRVMLGDVLLMVALVREKFFLEVG